MEIPAGEILIGAGSEPSSSEGSVVGLREVRLVSAAAPVRRRRGRRRAAVRLQSAVRVGGEPPPGGPLFDHKSEGRHRFEGRLRRGRSC